METVANERELVAAYREAKQKKEDAESLLKKLREDYDRIEAQLIEAMTANEQEATARYEGLGYVRLMKPRLYASYRKENEETVLGFLKDQGRDDLIKLSVHPASLSSFVAERLEAGDTVPDLISYYLKPQVRLYE